MYYLYDKNKTKVTLLVCGQGLKERKPGPLCACSEHAWKGMGVPFGCVMSTWGEIVEGKVSRSEIRSRPFSISWYTARVWHIMESNTHSRDEWLDQSRFTATLWKAQTKPSTSSQQESRFCWKFMLQIKYGCRFLLFPWTSRI